MQFFRNLFHCMKNGNFDQAYTYNISIFMGYVCNVLMHIIYTHVLISWVYTYLRRIFTTSHVSILESNKCNFFLIYFIVCRMETTIEYIHTTLVFLWGMHV